MAGLRLETVEVLRWSVTGWQTLDAPIFPSTSFSLSQDAT